MTHHCRSSQYSNHRPRYVLGRTIPEAAGIAGAAVLGYLMFGLTKGMPYGGQAGKMHLLLIFAAAALPLVIGFVFFADGAEPYPRQVVGYLWRRAYVAVRSVPARLPTAVRRRRNQRVRLARAARAAQVSRGTTLAEESR